MLCRMCRWHVSPECRQLLPTDVSEIFLCLKYYERGNSADGRAVLHESYTSVFLYVDRVPLYIFCVKRIWCKLEGSVCMGHKTRYFLM
jgi:hypothetical protein